MNRTLVLLNIIISLFFYSSTSKAACKVTETPGSGYFTTFAQTITIQKDLPVGSLIAKQSYPATTGPLYDCTLGSTLLMINNNDNYGSSTVVPYAYSRDNNGIGIRISSSLLPSGYYGNNLETFTVNKTGLWGADDTVSVEIFKIGPISENTVTLATGVAAGISAYEGQALRKTIFFRGITIKQVGCSTLSPSTLSLNMGTVNTEIFNNTVGKVGPRSSSSQVTLDCIAGTKVSLTLSGINDSDNTGAISLTNKGSAGVASGVAVNVYMNDVKLTPGNKVTLDLSTAKSIQYSAAYVQTKSIVTPGTANATATLTYSYE